MEARDRGSYEWRFRKVGSAALALCNRRLRGTTRTIPAGQIGNAQPISIVTEVWTSPDLKTIVYSKRSDPRMGEQTFRLTNIVLGEPDPSSFSIPADFKILDGPKPIIYRSN